MEQIVFRSTPDLNMGSCAMCELHFVFSKDREYMEVQRDISPGTTKLNISLNNNSNNVNSTLQFEFINISTDDFYL